MVLLKYSLRFAIRAIPHLFVSKFFYEFRLWSYGAAVMVFSLLAFFTVPALIVLAPLSAAFSKTALALTNLHSMLGYIGIVQKQVEEYVIAETLKMTLMRTVFYLLATLFVLPIALVVYGPEHIALLFSDPLAFLQLEAEQLAAGRLPATVFAGLIYAPIGLLIDCLLAVPMAAAAYALGPSDRVFNGVWGLGFNFWEILASRLIYFLIIAFTCLLVIAFFVPEVSVAALCHHLLSAFSQTPPDTVAYPLSAPQFQSLGSQLALVCLFLIGNTLAQPLWLATCVLSFRLRLDEEIEREEKARPCADEAKDERLKMRESHAELRRKRMPARWQT